MKKIVRILGGGYLTLIGIMLFANAIVIFLLLLNGASWEKKLYDSMQEMAAAIQAEAKEKSWSPVEAQYFQDELRELELKAAAFKESRIDKIPISEVSANSVAAVTGICFFFLGITYLGRSGIKRLFGVTLLAYSLSLAFAIWNVRQGFHFSFDFAEQMDVAARYVAPEEQWAFSSELTKNIMLGALTGIGTNIFFNGLIPVGLVWLRSRSQQQTPK